MNRVFITGLGAVSCAGYGHEGLWKAILEERSGIGALTRFKLPHLKAKTAGEIHDFHPENWMDRRQVKRMDRCAQFAFTATRMAIEDAQVMLSETQRHSDWGVSLGTALAGISDAESQYDLFRQHGIRKVNPMLALMIFGGSASSNIAIEWGLTGPCTTSSNSCASGTIAIGEAFRLIQSGKITGMICGGCEAPLTPLTYSAFDLIKTMSHIDHPSYACCPFDKRRDGFVMAEGAGILILESESSAKARNARVYAEVLGYSVNCDAWHMTSSLESGECAARCMIDAIQDANLSPQDITAINAHASSTQMNDFNETTAMKKVFGSHADRLMISGTKAVHGHALGATGAMEAVLSALSLHHQYVPPTLHLNHPDPFCDLDYVPLHGRKTSFRYLMSNSFGFGGVNASLVFASVAK